MPKYCPTCGNSSDKIAFYGNFCSACTKEKFSNGLQPGVEILFCKRCGRIKAGGAFASMSGKNLELAIKPTFRKYVVHLLDYSKDKAKIEVSEETAFGPLAVDHDIELTYKKALCDICYKKACNYHEAVVQLRGNSHRIKKFMESISRYFDAHNEFVCRIEQADNGMDMYMSNKRLTAAFISRSKIHPTVSFTLAGVRNGKKLYKNTYAIHFD